MILTDHGYGVDTAPSGEEAWELFQKHHFDVVVTDFKMGGIDGVELIRRVRGASPATGVILLSGFIDCLGLNAKTAGADELINKSNKEIQDLLRAIRRLAVRPRRRKPPASQSGPNARATQAG